MCGKQYYFLVTFCCACVCIRIILEKWNNQNGNSHFKAVNLFCLFNESFAQYVIIGVDSDIQLSDIDHVRFIQLMMIY